MQSDIAVPRIAFPDYAVLPNKNVTGRPLQVMVSRQVAAPYVTFYPVPDDAASYLFVYWRMRRMQDAGSGANTMDVPFRVLPALVAGLAYYLCTKLPGAEGRLNILKAQYDDAWSQMASEDRDRAPVRLTPRIGRV